MSKLTSETLSTVFLPSSAFSNTTLHSKSLSSTGLSSDVISNDAFSSEVVSNTILPSESTPEEVPSQTWKEWVAKHSSFLYGVLVGGAATAVVHSLLRKRR